MSEDGFCFSQNKRFRRVTFDEFLAVAKTLHQVVSARRRSAQVEVVTAEDHTTYTYSNCSFHADEITAALENRKSYDFEQLTREIWDRAFDVEVVLRDERDPRPLRISVTCDKYADGKRMRFYGQCLDPDMCRAVIKEFRRRTLWHGIGDGLRKVSDANLVIGARITGIRLRA
jgi:hypothetical protein